MSRRLKAALGAGLAALALASPGPGLAETVQAGSPTRPEILQPDADESLQSSAAVVVINELRRQGNLGGKLFGTAGGDPAMNGLYTYLAFYISTADGWRIFRLGDFISYRLLGEAPGRITLEIRESTMDQATGRIGSRTRRLAVSWTPGPESAPPATVRIAPAR